MEPSKPTLDSRRVTTVAATFIALFAMASESLLGLTPARLELIVWPMAMLAGLVVVGLTLTDIFGKRSECQSAALDEAVEQIDQLESALDAKDQAAS